jgi:hypothetical protein
MPAVIPDLFTSKKFVFVLVVSVLAGVASYFGVMTKAEALGLLGVLWPVYLGSQGLADVGQKLADAHVIVQTERQDAITQDKAGVNAMVNALLPSLVQYLQSTTPSGVKVVSVPLKKGARVVAIHTGPDEIGVVLEDQAPDTATVRALFKGDPVETGSVYDRLDLVAVGDDYVGPSATAAAVAAAKAKASKQDEPVSGAV